MPTKIVEHLFLGDEADARSWPGTLICVADRLTPEEPMKAIYLPIIADSKSGFWGASDWVIGTDVRMLDAVARTIEERFQRGEDVLVHCDPEMKRSPLAVAWFLHRRRGMNLDAAHALLVRLRPDIGKEVFAANRIASPISMNQHEITSDAPPTVAQ